jgi:hypothetical protein
MIIEPKILAARGSLIDANEVSILFDLVKNSSRNVRMNILDTLTHLPLPKPEWDRVVKLIRQELQEVESFKEQAALLEIGTWIPSGFDLENEVGRLILTFKKTSSMPLRGSSISIHQEWIMITSGRPRQHRVSFCSRNRKGQP